MRKHRKWLMGFGIGLIMGASVLQLILFAQEQERGLAAGNAPKTYTQEELDAAVAQALEQARQASAPNGTPSPEASPTGWSSPDASAAASASTKPDLAVSSSPDSRAEPVQIVSFYIHRGMNLTTVARSLKKLGLIEDPDDFTDEARPYSKEIQPGTSIFTGSPTYEEIIAELIRPKDG